jgi:hypothetical protein
MCVQCESNIWGCGGSWPGWRCTHAGVFLVDEEDFPLDPASFRVAPGWADCFFVSGDFVRDWVYYDLDDLNDTVYGCVPVVGRGWGVSLIDLLVLRHLFLWCKKVSYTQYRIRPNVGLLVLWKQRGLYTVFGMVDLVETFVGPSRSCKIFSCNTRNRSCTVCAKKGHATFQGKGLQGFLLRH